MPVMRRASPLIALVLALVGAAPAGAASFSSGVAAGDITSTSAVLWTRAPRKGTVRVVVIDRDARIPTGKFRQVRARGSGRVVRLTIRGLAPGTTTCSGSSRASQVSGEGQFETAPRSSSNRRVQFVVHGGATTDARPRTNSDGDLPGDRLPRRSRRRRRRHDHVRAAARQRDAARCAARPAATTSGTATARPRAAAPSCSGTRP